MNRHGTRPYLNRRSDCVRTQSRSTSRTIDPILLASSHRCRVPAAILPATSRTSCSFCTGLRYRRKWELLEETDDHAPDTTTMRVRPLRSLIVNADDFGASRGVNRGIIEAHEHGIVTSASLMVDGAAAAEAAEFARGTTDLGVGLHVELRRWRRGLPPWRGAALSTAGVRRHARRELQRQLDRFRLLVGRDPTHLDSRSEEHTS